MNILLKAAILTVATAGLSACGPNPKSSAGFTLPQGDVAQGKANYVEFGCNSCHGHVDVPQMAGADSVSVTIGGESARVRTYGELVTSVINPSHRVARRSSEGLADESGNSKMVTFNDVMTVTQLVDLVAFLQSSYKLSPYQNTAYPVYWVPESQREKK